MNPTENPHSFQKLLITVMTNYNMAVTKVII